MSVDPQWQLYNDEQRREMGLGPSTKPDDPAFILLLDEHVTVPMVHDDRCYICNDPEFAQMGLPLCRPCPRCSQKAGQSAGHVAADDSVCTVCDWCEDDEFENAIFWLHMRGDTIKLRGT